jgi:TonB family protein
VITFRLTQSGQLLSAQVARSSGVVAVNRAALKTVKEIRFPPFPKDMPRHPITFEVSVNLSAQPVTTAPAASLQYAMHPAHTTGQALLAPPSRFGASPLLSSMIRNDDTHCLAGLPLDAPWPSGASVPATVVQFVPRMDVLRDIAWNNWALHGMIAPRYLRNQRVLLHPDGSRAGVTMLAVVPADMRVTIGEHVQMDQYHAFHRAPCTYVPNLIKR